MVVLPHWATPLSPRMLLGTRLRCPAGKANIGRGDVCAAWGQAGLPSLPGGAETHVNTVQGMGPAPIGPQNPPSTPVQPSPPRSTYSTFVSTLLSHPLWLTRNPRFPVSNQTHLFFPAGIWRVVQCRRPLPAPITSPHAEAGIGFLGAPMVPDRCGWQCVRQGQRRVWKDRGWVERDQMKAPWKGEGLEAQREGECASWQPPAPEDPQEALEPHFLKSEVPETLLLCALSVPQYVAQAAGCGPRAPALT